jgi:hypothetical protein
MGWSPYVKPPLSQQPLSDRLERWRVVPLGAAVWLWVAAVLKWPSPPLLLAAVVVTVAGIALLLFTSSPWRALVTSEKATYDAALKEGLAAFEGKDLHRAAIAFGRASWIRPTPDAIFCLASVLEQLGDPSALSTYREAVGPWVWIHPDRYAELTIEYAKASFRLARADHPEDPAWYWNDAVEACQRAASRFEGQTPLTDELHLARGVALFYAGRDDESRKELLRVGGTALEAPTRERAKSLAVGPAFVDFLKERAFSESGEGISKAFRLAVDVTGNPMPSGRRSR